MQASTTVSVRAASPAPSPTKQGASSADMSCVAHLVAAERGFGQRGEFGRTHQRHLAALREIVDQFACVYSRLTVPLVPSTETRLVFEEAQAGLIAGTVPTNGTW